MLSTERQFLEVLARDVAETLELVSDGGIEAPYARTFARWQIEEMQERLSDRLVEVIRLDTYLSGIPAHEPHYVSPLLPCAEMACEGSEP